MSFFVYIHTCPNNKKYVGVTTSDNVEDRWKDGKGYKTQCFYKAIIKYGWENIQHEYFETESRELMMLWEKLLIYHYKSTNKKFGYNKTNGGESTVFSEEAKANMSKAATGRKMTDETKAKISKTLKGVLKNPLSEEHKKKLSKAAKRQTPYWTGKKRSEETKRKLSEAIKGKKTQPHTEETRKKISEAKKLYWENKRKNNT